MKIEVRNVFLLTIITTVMELIAFTSASSSSFLHLDEFNSSPTRHNHRYHPSTHHQQQQSLKDNFILIDYLSDGERERRISWNGIVGKETSVGDSSKTLTLWQMSNGKAFIQMIFTSDNQLMDCEYVRRKALVANFVDQFIQETNLARTQNLTSNNAAPHKRPLKVSSHDFREFIENGIVTSEMEQLQSNLNEFSNGGLVENDEDSFKPRNMSYIRLDSESDIPEDILKQLNYQRLKNLCDKRHRQMQNMAHGVQSAEEVERKSAEETLQRHKRAIADWFLSPNTKWCGRGHSAEHYHQLGGASRADMCCRQHDFCKVNIPGLTTKWGLFNFRIYTISHCSCDQRFRTCLKMADSSDANMVGKLFFNIVQSKCFVLKSEKQCTKTSWWGKCEKTVRRKRAHIRDNRKY